MSERRTKSCILASVLAALLACSGDKDSSEGLPPYKPKPVPKSTMPADAAVGTRTPAPAPTNVVVPKGAIRLRAAPAGWAFVLLAAVHDVNILATGWSDAPVTIGLPKKTKKAFVQLTAASGTTYLPVQGGAVIGPKDWIKTINKDRHPFKLTWKNIRLGDASAEDTQGFINQPSDLGPGRYALRIKLGVEGVDISLVGGRRWHFRTASRTQLRLGGVGVVGKRRFALLGDGLEWMIAEIGNVVGTPDDACTKHFDQHTPELMVEAKHIRDLADQLKTLAIERAAAAKKSRDAHEEVLERITAVRDEAMRLSPLHAINMQKHRAELGKTSPLPFCDAERGGVERVWQVASIDTDGVVLEAVVYDRLNEPFPKLAVGDKAPLQLPISD